MVHNDGGGKIMGGGFNAAGEPPIKIRGFSLATAALAAGALITLSSFAAFFTSGGGGGTASVSSLGFIYGIPTLLVGAALAYAELEPVPVTYDGPEAKLEALFERKANEAMRKVREDVTRHRYGDDAHLDTTTKALGLVEPGRPYPILLEVKLGETSKGDALRKLAHRHGLQRRRRGALLARGPTRSACASTGLRRGGRVRTSGAVPYAPALPASSRSTRGRSRMLRLASSPSCWRVVEQWNAWKARRPSGAVLGGAHPERRARRRWPAAGRRVRRTGRQIDVLSARRASEDSEKAWRLLRLRPSSSRCRFSSEFCTEATESQSFRRAPCRETFPSMKAR